MKLAVMSDIHIGIASRSKDLCPAPSGYLVEDSKRYEKKIDDSYQEKFFNFIKRENLSADYLLLPGDITNRAHPREVELASKFILSTAESLGVPEDKIVFVPGNHDVDWSVIDPEDTTGVRWEQRYAPIGHKNFHFQTLIEQGNGNVLTPPYFSVWEYQDMVVVGYNSASHDSPLSKDEAHHGLADPKHLSKIHEYLEDYPETDDRIRLFLVHHHSINFKAPIPETPDFSLMVNADSLLSLLHKCKFDLLIHGHMHHPRFETHTTHSYPHLPILCSGSFSAEIDTKWAGTVDNQFHIVTVSGRTGSENLIKGQINSWTHNHCRGWVPSEESVSGIHHIIPFGSYLMPNELDAPLESFIKIWFEKHDYILWKDVIKKYPDLKHLPIDSAIEAFKRMADIFNRQTMYQTLKDLILY